jgi:hypothetical protein
MSAHYGAPGFRRPQLATPSYPASPQGSSTPVRAGGAPVVRRKALFVAVATLCAPALAAVALAAIGATGGSGQAGMGSLAGTAGLRGTTTPAVSSPDAPVKHMPASRLSDASHQSDAGESPPVRQTKQQGAPTAPSPAPVHHPAPSPAPKPAPKQPHTTPAPHTVSPPSVPTSDPTGPGAPITSGTSSGTSGAPTTDPGTTSGSGSSSHHSGGGTADGYDAYSGSSGGD